VFDSVGTAAEEQLDATPVAVSGDAPAGHSSGALDAHGSQPMPADMDTYLLLQHVAGTSCSSAMPAAPGAVASTGVVPSLALEPAANWAAEAAAAGHQEQSRMGARDRAGCPLIFSRSAPADLFTFSRWALLRRQPQCALQACSV
jgi:hypothetical protein